jgi:hypothetical protein
VIQVATAGEVGEMMARVMGSSDEHQVFVIGKVESPAPVCQRCGEPVELPPAEVLDLDRNPYGWWHQSLDEE